MLSRTNYWNGNVVKYRPILVVQHYRNEKKVGCQQSNTNEIVLTSCSSTPTCSLPSCSTACCSSTPTCSLPSCSN